MSLGRYVTVPVIVSEDTHDSLTGRGDPQQRFRLYRLCLCESCGGTGKRELTNEVLAEWGPQSSTRCPKCRGEGKALSLVATAANAAGIGEAIIHNALEGNLEDCPIGILEDGGGWLVKPWLPSARNVSDAGRSLAEARWQKGESNARD